ncbi:hypothetical protein A11A3_05134 [Alcanivorax hongdengensis A-11-3]|uniref:Spermidine synthase n=1 Tax=Alcanivorax hongdengensis A-11-3 TaxID=1177179 RepID=L0WE98_9GAMM|nr:hypothetical protein [Alcanivorax hongdengensis]EKF75049.1 hypothetical protein A11A3_05134 [Alcanivorax hongdengensis A-11-3]
MTVVWSSSRDGVDYEVRRAGQTLSLYANGVQHSEFHPQRLLTGSVWDLLWLPALLHEPERYRRVLVLGLGGGSLIPPLRRLLDPETLVAVEMDGCHLEVARDVFGIAERFAVQTHQGDAVSWLRDYQGPPFDLIIEDLFAASNRQVSRAVPAELDWLAVLSANLSAQGMLVMNFGDWPEYRDSALVGQYAMAGYASRFRLSCSDCHNAVIAFSREPARSIHLRRRLASLPALSGRREKARLDYHIRQLD